MNENILENNFLVIKNFIDFGRAEELSYKFKKYCEENYSPPDPQVPNTPSKYNYLPFLEILCEKTPVVSDIVGETVLPTYCYSRVYKNGDVLDKHTDRDACEISLTLHLDGDEEWEIYIETPSGKEVAVNLNKGDALLYLGCIAPHWRDKFNGNFYSQVFLHYVRSNGEKSYTYFDKQKDILSYNKCEIKSSSKLESFIKVYENIISEDLCDLILSEYSKTNEWTSTKIGDGDVNKQIRNCEVISLSTKETISKNTIRRKEIDKRIFDAVSHVITDLKSKFSTITIAQDSGYDLLKYDVGGFYTQHTDSFTTYPRAISCSLILNDDYEGGEFGFFDRELVYKLKKGSVITFPSNHLYPHEIMPVTKGTRYSIITWFV
jgi:predicted 2-oxoglutarate/Fe(II)-dependent dioxygenase YbiX